MILKHVNWVDVKKGTINRAERITIDNGRIKSIGSGEQTESNKGIDLKYKWLLSGLIDLHVHVAEEPELGLAKRFRFDEPERKSIVRMKRNLKTALMAGVTTLRDVGSYDARGLLAKKLVENEKIIGPRIYTCGHSLTPYRGHWFERSREVEDNPKSIRKAVEGEINSGADFIKIMIEIPVFFSKSTILEAVKTTHKYHKKISAHAAYPKSIKLAIEAGVDTLEHTGNIPKVLLNRAIRQGITIIPTYYIAHESVNNPLEAFLFDTDASIPGTKQDAYQLVVKWLNILDKGLPKLFKSPISTIFLKFSSRI